jgi:hypothetical protein
MTSERIRIYSRIKRALGTHRSQTGETTGQDALSEVMVTLLIFIAMLMYAAYSYFTE